ncbi:unnamed protein product [Rotaria sp. Silwood1]|nr:unnamed protein product [Rotaria sp. Silwood1]CAF3570784.1 unnamed protein product [Rotaria sp. Silwood1]CAF3594861.1 unnamed protein product [Rotaria sp. Silwood1]CAF4906898.1 unnamed protein product [Rotaria sp. Silwood1]CAF4938397.1 unnamed protein product [Rotaria sp. Silwood1]
MKFNTTNDLDYHKLNECTKITIPCALKDYGCLTSVVRVEIGEHYKSEEHQSAIINFIRRILSKINDQHDRGSTMDVDTLSHTTMLSSDNINNQLQEVCQTIDILADGVSTLNGDAQRLSQESLQLHNTIDNLTREFAILKISIQEQGTYLDGLKPNQDVLNQDVASLKQKLDDMQFVSYDGTLLWKIPNFSSRMADAQSERQTSIYSPPFYSSPTGYKMRGRLYLNGDGNARRTHMSLFFVLMRSEYDAILKFPFNYKVTFCLYDQTPAQRHIIDSFRPDVKSNSFQRPRSEMNIASGIPKFCSLSTIQQEGNAYVRDDTMFIKIMVDFADTPKTLLPFALTLNPGFPINIQQTLLKQEAEKRTQQTSTPPAT